MRLRACALAILSCCLAATPAGADEVSVTLTLADASAGDAVVPYSEATLAVQNSLPETISAVSLRADDGGPTLIYPVTFPPSGDTREITVALPATSLMQTYTIELLDRYDNGRDDGPAPRLLAEVAADALDEARKNGHAPHVVEAATSQLLNDQAFAVFAGERPVWSGRTKQSLLLVLAGMTVLGGFTLLIPMRWIRVAALAVVVGGAAGGLFAVARPLAAPLTRSVRREVCMRDADGRIVTWTIAVVGARRTVVEPIDQPGAMCAYRDRVVMGLDRTVVRPAEPEFSGGVPVSCPIGPYDLRMFIGRQETPDGPGRPAAMTRRIEETDAGKVWVVQSDRPTSRGVIRISRRADILPVQAMAGGNARRISEDRTRRVRHLRADPAAFGFEGESLKLLNWWEQTQRRSSKTYFVYPTRVGDVVRLNVSVVKEP